ncbi:unnamed protein product, partial [Polarella glacialis]
MPPAGHRRRRPATFVALAAAATGLGITAPAALFRSRSDAAADASSSSKQTHIYSDQAPRRRARTHSELDQIGGNLFYATSAELEETSPRHSLTVREAAAHAGVGIVAWEVLRRILPRRAAPEGVPSPRPVTADGWTREQWRLLELEGRRRLKAAASYAKSLPRSSQAAAVAGVSSVLLCACGLGLRRRRRKLRSRRSPQAIMAGEDQ